MKVLPSEHVADEECRYGILPVSFFSFNRNSIKETRMVKVAAKENVVERREQFAFRCTTEEAEVIRKAIDADVEKHGRRRGGRVYGQQDYLRDAVVNRARRQVSKGKEADGKKT